MSPKNWGHLGIPIVAVTAADRARGALGQDAAMAT
jgi:hypothetical protein